jgi:hypothetical protein
MGVLIALFAFLIGVGFRADIAEAMHSWRFLLSVGPLLCFFAALRTGAPKAPGFAGAVAGVAASGISATFYTANCTDDSPLFVATWYPLAILLVSAIGCFGGRLVRW